MRRCTAGVVFPTLWEWVPAMPFTLSRVVVYVFGCPDEGESCGKVCLPGISSIVKRFVS